MIFDFNSSERRGLMLLSIIIVLSIGFRVISPLISTKSETDFTKFKKEITEFELAQKILEQKEKESKILKQKEYNNYYTNKKKSTYKKNNKQLKYFKLNPNKASISDWEKFGFSKKQSKVIYNYIKKSGGISDKKQLKNIFVINSEKYKEIESYIIIDKTELPKNNYYKTNNTSEKNKTKIIEINSASKENLMSIRGIGETLSGRIIKYREMLGGFYSTKQLNEVYGIKPETYEKIKDFFNVDKDNINKININFSNEKDLSSHPYISYKEAKAIVQYRTKKGFINDVNILIAEKLLNNSKALPYLVCQD